MNAYSTFIKSISADQSCIEQHIYFYVRMELALCKLQLCKDLSAFETLKLDYADKFLQLSKHIVSCLNSCYEHQNNGLLNRMHKKIESCNFDKISLDICLDELNLLVRSEQIVVVRMKLNPKDLNLSA